MNRTYILLLGLPGSGKGTLAKGLPQKLQTVHISCGDVFRSHVYRQTPFGKRAVGYIQRGELTPDEDTSSMFLAHLREQPNGQVCMLEGYPRTMTQVSDFEKHLEQQGDFLAVVIHLEAPVGELIRRISDRRICSKCGQIYNLRSRPPQQDAQCDLDGEPLVQRADDHEHLIRRRISVYDKAEQPILKYYRTQGLLRPVDTNRFIDIVTNDIADIAELR